MSVPTHQQAQRLIDHARQITQDVYTFSFELTEENRDKAAQKLNYAKHVLKSLDEMPEKYMSSEDKGEEYLTILYTNLISVRPGLENAINELQECLDQNKYYKNNMISTEEQPTKEDILAKLQENVPDIQLLPGDDASDESDASNSSSSSGYSDESSSDDDSNEEKESNDDDSNEEKESNDHNNSEEKESNGNENDDDKQKTEEIQG